MLPRLFAKIGTNMIYLYDIYIYILYNNTYDFKNTHLLPQHFCKNVANMEYIYVCLTYIYTILYLSSNYLCTSQGLLPQLAFSKPVVSLGGVFSLQELIRLTATTDMFQACGESKWCDSLQEIIGLTATTDMFQACSESGWCGSLQEIIV